MIHALSFARTKYLKVLRARLVKATRGKLGHTLVQVREKCRKETGRRVLRERREVHGVSAIPKGGFQALASSRSFRGVAAKL